MRLVEVVNADTALKSPLVVGYCQQFWCKWRGLSFRRSLAPNEGLVMVEGRESRIATAIHMLGMAFDLTIVWMDKSRRVVDVQLARRWRSYLFPRKAACYVLECAVSRFEEFQIGDQLEFKDQPTA